MPRSIRYSRTSWARSSESDGFAGSRPLESVWPSMRMRRSGCLLQGPHDLVEYVEGVRQELRARRFEADRLERNQLLVGDHDVGHRGGWRGRARRRCGNRGGRIADRGHHASRSAVDAVGQRGAGADLQEEASLPPPPQAESQKRSASECSSGRRARRIAGCTIAGQVLNFPNVLAYLP
jgi:hypothetical protein